MIVVALTPLIRAVWPVNMARPLPTLVNMARPLRTPRGLCVAASAVAVTAVVLRFVKASRKP